MILLEANEELEHCAIRRETQSESNWLYCLADTMDLHAFFQVCLEHGKLTETVGGNSPPEESSRSRLHLKGQGC